jgi:hypothetical protein
MQLFSKMVREEHFSFLEIEIDSADASSNDICLFEKDSSLNTPRIITYAEYMQTPEILSKSTIKTLKATAQHLSTKTYRVHKHGNKPELIERLHTYFDKWTKAIKIQRKFRRFLVSRARILRGPAYTDLSKCVNETDFFTMDPLIEIDRRHFYSYADTRGFVYGFDVFSLMHIFKREGKILNPYTREELSDSRVIDVFSLFRKIQILHPDSCGGKYVHISNASSPKNSQARQDTGLMRERRMATRMAELKQLPMTQRIEELFMAIDRLGNYTQSRWFSDLTKLEYVRFYDSYYVWWNRLPVATKRDVCYIMHPFSNIRFRPLDEVEREEYQDACVTLMEHMVFTGMNEESRRLGALHVLSQLTRVSYLARVALPWLYDSF